VVKGSSEELKNETLNPRTLEPWNPGILEPFLMKLTRKEFEKVVTSALRGLPKSLKKRMENIDVVIEAQASSDLLSEMGLRSPFDLLGLYQGIPLDQRGFYYGNVLPDKITLFQYPIESICKTKEEIEEKVREVVIHEVGHYFGLDEDRLEELEED
jgi:predicted Zn-dependent protease with MMP-like domain